mgnify:CR=1 FL=1
MKITRALKNLDAETVKELEAMDVASLDTRIVEANRAMQQMQDELDENPEYQELKESLKAVTAGLKEVKKRQNSIICIALHMKSEKGKA